MAAKLLTVTFDRLLTPGLTAPGNWTGAALDVVTKDFTGSAPGPIAGNQAQATVFLGLPGAPPNRVSYAATPPNVVSTFGIPAAPFADFPLALLP